MVDDGAKNVEVLVAQQPLDHKQFKDLTETMCSTKDLNNESAGIDFSGVIAVFFWYVQGSKEHPEDRHVDIFPL